MGIKTSFSIKDLENLSGVKAHTIRIWEKRYNLLEPERSDTNIRTYDITNLQKILNIALLNQQGFKVSKIAGLNEGELYKKVRELVVESKTPLHSINSFKLAMLNFDQQLFDHTYNQLLAQSSFRDIFLKVFLQLLEDIGNLWITNTITPAHEHFISSLITQKLLINIERMQNTSTDNTKVFVLFLPMDEIHELGLLYVHFELLIKGYKSVYLGPSVPIESLVELQKIFSDLEFVSYFTVQPASSEVDAYLKEMESKILKVRGEKFHIIGRKSQLVDVKKKPENVVIHKSMLDLIKDI